MSQPPRGAQSPAAAARCRSSSASSRPSRPRIATSTRPEGQIRGLQSEQEPRPARAQSPLPALAGAAAAGPLRDALAELHTKLEINRRALAVQLKACEAVSEIITRAIQDGQSDGTYTAPRLEPVARMMKAALVGVAAVAAVIAGEMGADKVLAMRQTHPTAPPQGRPKRARRMRSMSLASRTARSRATRSCSRVTPST